jgi:hypothetical protein|tara:strand:+ start:618 stop:1097 length:480 start_codon:yes stop_codon:yes gene_type:complete
MNIEYINPDDRTVYLAHPIDSSKFNNEHLRVLFEFFVYKKWTVYSPEHAFIWSGENYHARKLRSINHHALMEMNFMVAIDPWRSVGVAREVQMRNAWKPKNETLITSTDGEIPRTPYLMDNGICTFVTMTDLVKHLSLRCSKEQIPPRYPSPTDPATLD